MNVKNQILWLSVDFFNKFQETRAVSMYIVSDRNREIEYQLCYTVIQLRYYYTTAIQRSYLAKNVPKNGKSVNKKAFKLIKPFPLIVSR